MVFPRVSVGKVPRVSCVDSEVNKTVPVTLDSAVSCIYGGKQESYEKDTNTSTLCFVAEFLHKEPEIIFCKRSQDYQ